MLKANTVLITTTDQLSEVVEDLLNCELLAIDTETDGLGRNAQVIGVSLATSPDTAYYIPIKIYKPGQGLIRPWSDEAFEYIRNVLIEAFTQSKRLLTHNGVFDAKVINNTFGVQILPYIFADTQLLHHLAIDESPPHGLKQLATKYLDPEAANPQQDLKDSVVANGGRWTKEEKDFWKGDWKLLGTYAAWDVIYTRGLFDKFYPELLKSPKLMDLWEKEVMPLMAVTYDLNTAGVRVDVEYFTNLKKQMQDKVKTIEDEIYAQLEDKIKVYELSKMKAAVNITPRSEFGRFLKLNNIWPWEDNSEIHDKALTHWYNKKYQGERMFNLDSGNDKAFLLYDVLKLPVRGMTESGKRSTSKATLDELADEFADSSAILKLLRDRSKELKLLSTYVDPILETHENGRIYPSFNQTGTTSGRYSCGGNSINLQTLPRDDHRVKSGFIPDEGRVFVAADFQALEPRCFSFVSTEPKLINTMKNGLDFYSTIAIEVLGMQGVSSDPSADNYLGKVDKEKRQWVKAIALSIPYGAQAGRLAQMMKIDYEEAQEIYEKYIRAFPSLKKWMDMSDMKMKSEGYVESIVGRRKRGKVIHTLYSKLGVRDFSKKGIEKVMYRYKNIDGIEDPVIMYLECRNSMNVAKNHQIQSLSASVCNQAAIDFLNETNNQGIKANLILQVHDELVASCSKEDAEQVAAILKRVMTTNRVTKMISVPLDAKPVVTDKNLAEAK